MKFKLPYGIHYHAPNEITNFSGTDSEKLYYKNRKVLKDIDWKWHHQKIEYRFNNLGFRCDVDFVDDFDFSEYVVVLGCSNVMGVGNMAHETIPGMLESKLNKKVINMGVGGGSNSLIYDNLMWLLSRKHRPLRIVVCWSSLYRELFLDITRGFANVDTESYYLSHRNINLHNMNECDGYDTNFINFYNQQYLTDYIERDAFMKFEMVKKMKDIGVYSFNFFNYGEYTVNGGALKNTKLKDAFLEHHNYGNSTLNDFHDAKNAKVKAGVLDAEFVNEYHAQDMQNLDHLKGLKRIVSHYPAKANRIMADFISKNIGL